MSVNIDVKLRENVLINIAKEYFEGMMSPSWYGEIESWFDRYHFEPEVVYALFKECARRNTLSSKAYISKVAANWSLRGIIGMKDLNSYVLSHDRIKRASKKIGQKLRKKMTEYDDEIVRRWIEKMGYNFDVIELALQKTTQMSNPNLLFIDRIIQEWFWLELHAEKQLEPKTIYEYRKMLGRINDAIGHIHLDQLQPTHLLDFYSNLSEPGIREDTRYKATSKLKSIMEKADLNASQLARKGKLGNSTAQAAVNGEPVMRKTAEAFAEVLKTKVSEIFKPVDGKGKLSGNTILHHHRLISSILTAAVEWLIISANPADRVRAPRAERREARFLDEVQARQIIEALSSELLQFRTMIIILIYTGIRRGELCGLKWSDIDFASGMLQVNRAIQYIPKVGLFEKLPKQNSVRPIKLPELASLILQEHKNAQAIEAAACGDAWTDMDLVFTRTDGTYYNPDDLSAAFHKFVTSKGLPSVSVHSLRHTNATLQIAGGVDISTVSRRLGHAQQSTTMNTYAHAIKSADESAASVLGDMLSPGKKADESTGK